MFSPTIQPTSWWPSATPPPSDPTSNPSSSNGVSSLFGGAQSGASMETIMVRLQRLEAKLDAFDPRPSASRPPPDPDPPYGLSWEWSSPPGTPASLATHSMEVSVPPWTSSTLPASPWPQAESFRQGFHEPISGMGLHTPGPPPHNSWDPPRSRIGLHTSGLPPPNSWDPPRSRLEEFQDQRSSWNTTAAFPSSWDPPTTRMETCGPSSPYEYDPILGRPRTSWDLPRPRIAPELGNNSSYWNYPESYGGESYEPYSHYGGYSGGSYANEHIPYAPPLPPPRDGYCVPAPQSNPPSYTHPQQPWESPWSRTAPDSFHTLSTWDQSSTHARGTIVATEEEGVNQVACAESETGVVDGVAAPVSDESVGSEEGDALNPEMDEVEEEECDFVTNDLEVGVQLSNDSNGSKAAKDGDYSEATGSYTRALEIKVDEFGEFAFSECDFGAAAYYKYGHATLLIMHALLYKAQEADPLGAIPKKGSEGSGRKGLKSREAFRRLVIFGLYALEEVYKDFCISTLRTR